MGPDFKFWILASLPSCVSCMVPPVFALLTRNDCNNDASKPSFAIRDRHRGTGRGYSAGEGGRWNGPMPEVSIQSARCLQGRHEIQFRHTGYRQSENRCFCIGLHWILATAESASAILHGETGLEYHGQNPSSRVLRNSRIWFLRLSFLNRRNLRIQREDL